MLESIGPTLDRYQDIERLNDEYWGSNFKAFDPKLDRTVVIQVLSAQWLEKSKGGNYPLHTTRAMMNWRYPGIARVFDVCQTEKSTYMVREYLPGGSLHQLLGFMRSQVKWISLPEAFQLVLEACRAMAHAHQRNILHGDLFPGNIFFRASPAGELPYQPVLVNLGLVKSTALHLVPTLPAYQSPEATGGGKLDKSTDVFSLGILLYELSTGQLPPVKDINDENWIQSPSYVRPDLPEALEKVILTAIARNTKERYPDAEVFAEVLTEIESQISWVNTAPPGFNQAISLLPAIQSHLQADEDALPAVDSLELRPDQTPEPSTATSSPFLVGVDLTKDQIHVLLPDQEVLSVSMQPTGLTIGRGAENDLVIDDPSVSRYHARLDFDGKDYLVQDLNSLNGTFLEDTRLAPGEPCTWLPGENLRLGEIWIRLEREGQDQTTEMLAPEAAPTRPRRRAAASRRKSTPRESTEEQLPETSPTFIRPDGRLIDPNQVTVSEGLRWVGAFTDTPHISATPGKVVSLAILLFNQSTKADLYRLEIMRLDPDWTLTPSQQIKIPANGRAEAQLSFRPPRSSEGKAGRHPMTVRITSQNSPDQFVELRLTLTVTVFSQFSSELRPHQIPSGQLGQVLVHNRGNLPGTYTVLLEDPQHELIFDPSQAKISVPAGQYAIVEFRPSLLRKRWFGGQETHNFNVHVSSDDGHLQSFTGEYSSRSLIPVWAPIALTVLCILMACLAIGFYNQITLPSRQARQTSEAGETALALIGQYTSEASTATADSLINANQATIQAATATAMWSAADDDQDNLANNLELLAGTKPDVADTDEDGLKDGDEINLQKTDPLLPDTDSDGWKDGEEIEKGTDPLRKDTDGDGILDPLDPDPLRAATKTPMKTATKIPTLTTAPTQPSTLQPTSTTTHTPTPQLKIADLTIDLTNEQTASVAGAQITYNIVVKNKGPGGVSKAQVVDLFPSLITDITWTCTATADSKCQSANGAKTLDALVDLEVNGSATFVVKGTLSPSATGLLMNSAAVNPPSGYQDPKLANNLSVDTDSIASHATLSISMTDDRSEITPGQMNTYTITVTNAGPSLVNKVKIYDDFPGKLNNVSWSCTATSGSSCKASGIQSGNVDTTTNLAPKGSVTIRASGTVKSSATGTLSNTASITSLIDPAKNNKSVTDTTEIVLEADLSLMVIAPFTTSVTSPVTYTINITNTGPSDANNVSLTQSIPAESVFVSVSPGSPTCEASTYQISCSIESLPVGQKFQAIVVLNTPSLPGEVVSQVEVSAESSLTDPNQENNTFTITVQIQ